MKPKFRYIILNAHPQGGHIIENISGNILIYDSLGNRESYSMSLTDILEDFNIDCAPISTKDGTYLPKDSILFECNDIHEGVNNFKEEFPEYFI